MTVGCVFTVIYGLQASSWGQFASIVAVALVIAGSFSLLGGLLGFLFGIPRTLQESKPTETISYQMNTNLEQISDWLTKILVGVGLTQLSSLPEALRTYAAFTAAGLGNFPSSQVFSIALLIGFSTSAFLVGYLWTRTYLAGAFKEADAAFAQLEEVKREIGGQLEKVERQVSDLEKQVKFDAEAFNLIQRLLNPPQDFSPPPQEEINDAIRLASPNMKTQIFDTAAYFRSENWEDPDNRHKMERTIPIFVALIASDKNYHYFHGQLGYALKDQRKPDWTRAEQELSKAIELRGPYQSVLGYGLLYYELNRAICRINLDSAFNQMPPKASDENSRQNIVADLRTVASEPHLIDKLLNNSNPINASLIEWMQVNSIIPSDFSV